MYVCTSLMNLLAKMSPLPFSSSVDPSPIQRNTCVYVSSRNTSSDRTGECRTGYGSCMGMVKREGEEECVGVRVGQQLLEKVYMLQYNIIRNKSR